MTQHKLFEQIKGIRKVVINDDWGSFGLSQEAVDLYKKYAGIPAEDDVEHWRLPRDDRHLVKVVEELGRHAGGYYASLKIVEIPAEVEWEVCDYDGVEWIAEKHRTWR